MELAIYQIDAFTNEVFRGNPACVMPLEYWLPDETLLNIAQENGVAETAFFVDHGTHFHIRWFTPEIEMDLCGHATLATAHCLVNCLGYEGEELIFESISGPLKVSYQGTFYHMDFPSREAKPTTLPKAIKQSLSIQPIEIYKSRDYLLVYEDEESIRDIQIERFILDQINLGSGGVIITAPGLKCDFVSRFFTPQASILEDPVTGSAHCTLSPYWSNRLNKTQLIAQQLSQRGGHILCEQRSNRVIISGEARTYSKGHCML